MGKIRVRALGDVSLEKEQKKDAKKRKVAKEAKKSHVEGVGLKGGQQLKVMEGVELKPEVEAILQHPEATEKKSKPKKAHVYSKRFQALRGMVERNKLYPFTKALELVKKTSTTRFDATVEVHIAINKELLTKEKPTMSGKSILPHGTGKKRIVKIADEDLIAKIAAGVIDFDILVSPPALMPKLAKVARILGPKGLMPNPKNGTVSPDTEKRAKELEGGEIHWKTEPDQPLIHHAVGKVSFTTQQLSENILSLVKSIDKNKITKFTLSSSMGPGVKVDLTTL